MPESRFAVLIFTDIVGSTDLKMRYGVPAFREALRIHNQKFEGLAALFPGFRILQNMGDGYFAEASGVAEAVRFALLFQQAMRDVSWSEVILKTRVGIHCGEVTALDSEGGCGIVAPAADLASRVMLLAVGGQILLTRLPFDEARHFIREHPPVEGKSMPPLQWMAHGPYRVKGCDEAVEIFEVGAECLAPLAPPPDGEKAKRDIRPGEEETLGWRPAAGLEIPGRPGWHLAERLGAGGFGEVWSGEHAKLRQRRAFKFCFDEERLRALKREVTLVRLLRSALGDRDDIVRVHEIKLDSPPFYLESDLAPHGNLLQWAEKMGGLGGIPLEQRIGLVAHTARALAAAHSIGVLHKDIKPTNILVFDGPGGEPLPRLVDFGIGTLAEPSVLAQYGLTGAGFTRQTLAYSTGTPTYSPPELLTGKPYTIQSDIYGLGVLLYQLVTCRPMDPLAAGWERDVPDQLLLKDIAVCIDGDPARRLSSAADLAERLLTLEKRREAIEELERLARDAEALVEAEAVALANRSRNLRLQRLVAAFAGLAFLAVAGGTMAWVNQRKATDAQQLAEGARKRAEGSEASALAQRDRASELLEFQAYSHALERGDLAVAFDRLSQAHKRNPRWEYGLGFDRIAAAARASFVPVQRIPCDDEPLQAVFCWKERKEDQRQIGARPLALPEDSRNGTLGLGPRQGQNILVLSFKNRLRSYDLEDGGKMTSFEYGENRDIISLHEIQGLGKDGACGVVASFREKPPLVLSLPELRPIAQGPVDMAGADVAVSRSIPLVASFLGRTIAVFDPETGRELARRTFDAENVDRISKVAVQPNGETIAVTSFRAGPTMLWAWKQDQLSSGERSQGIDFASDETLLGTFSIQQAADSLDLEVRDSGASGSCKLDFPAVPMGRLVAHRIAGASGSSSEDLIASMQDDSSVEFIYLSGAANGPNWKGEVSERHVAKATAVAPHSLPGVPAKLLVADPSTQQLAIRFGNGVDVYAPRKAIFGQKPPGRADRICLPSSFWAACQDGNNFWTVVDNLEIDGQPASTVSRFEFSNDGSHTGRHDFNLRAPLELAGETPGQILAVGLAVDRARNSVYILWERVSTSLHTDQSASLDLMVARYEIPSEGTEDQAISNLTPVQEFRLSAHPRGGLRTIREFFVDASGEILVYATESAAAGYSVRDGKLVYRLPPANRFAVSRDKKYLGLGNWRENRKVEVLDCRNGEKLMETDESNPTNSFAFSPDGASLAVGWKSGVMKTYDVITGVCLQTKATDLAPILLLPGGDRYLGIRARDANSVGEVFLVDAAEASPIDLLGPSHTLNHWYVNPDGNLIAQASKYETILFRRRSPQQVGAWLDKIWSGGIVSRSSVIEGSDGMLSKQTLFQGVIDRTPPDQ